MMTLQEILSTAAIHLLKQGKPSKLLNYEDDLIGGDSPSSKYIWLRKKT